MRMFTRCEECLRIFDLCDPVDAEEWSNGHDCEAPTKAIPAPPKAEAKP